MLLLTCPICGISADETEFTHGGPAPEAATGPIPRGTVCELWLCAAGCGSWFALSRHSVNQRITAVEPIGSGEDAA